MSLRRSLFAPFVCATLFFLSPAAVHSAFAQIQVAAIGDSNVYGKGVSTSENYPSQLRAALNARGLNVNVSNGGINGDTSAGLAGRLDSAVPSGTRVAVIWIGVNDARRGVSRQEIQANVAGIVSRLKARGIESYVIRPPVYDVADHQNPALTVGGGDKHFNAAGYRKMVGKTIGPIAALVGKAAKKKAD
jgi:acyl-CoA thioesterase-1